MKELIEKLKKYNRWRRGDETVPQPHPQEVGEMIDQAVEALEGGGMFKACGLALAAEFEEWRKNKEGEK